MADKILTCTVLTPEEAVYEGEVSSVVAPGVDGYLGVLHNHAPLISALGKGELKVTDSEGGHRYWNIEGGFLEVLKNKVSVLTTRVEEIEKKRTGWD